MDTLDVSSPSEGTPEFDWAAIAGRRQAALDAKARCHSGETKRKPTPPKLSKVNRGKALAARSPKQVESDRAIKRERRMARWEELGGRWYKPLPTWTQRDKRRWKLYGVTPGDILRIRIEQDGRCAVCEQRDALVVDHDHATGKARGLLCSGCNKAEGFLRGSAENAIVLAAYLSWHAEPLPASSEAQPERYRNG